MKIVPLSTGLGEIMAPQTLVTALILSPDGFVTVDPGALHGRSEVESEILIVDRREQVPDPQVYWFVWVAVELDASSTPVRYKGIAASALWARMERRVGYKVLADQVNRMAEAMRGGVNLKMIGPAERAKIGEQLAQMSAEAWERASDAFKEALRA